LVSFQAQRLHLLDQQSVGSLELFVAQQQMIHTFGDLIDGVGMGHGNQEKGSTPL
jgi:hypothetical protein